jgi:hypothetical protein
VYSWYVGWEIFVAKTLPCCCKSTQWHCNVNIVMVGGNGKPGWWVDFTIIEGPKWKIASRLVFIRRIAIGWHGYHQFLVCWSADRHSVRAKFNLVTFCFFDIVYSSSISYISQHFTMTLWYVSNVSIIFYALCLFIHHLFLCFVTLRGIFMHFPELTY